MSATLKTVIYPVSDLAAAKPIFAALLGAEPVMDEPYYVQFHTGDQEVGLDPNGRKKGMTGPVGYWHVEDIEKAIAVVVDAGGEINEPVNDFGGGPRKVASAKDSDGNVIGFIQES